MKKINKQCAHCVTVVDWYDCKSFSPSKKGPPAGAQTINYEFFQRKLSQPAAAAAAVWQTRSILMTMMIAKRAPPQHTTMLQEPSFPQSFTLIDFPTSTVLLWHGDAMRGGGAPRSAGCILDGWRGRACSPIQLCDVFYLVYPFFNRS